MFRVRMILQSVMRHRRRNIVSCLLLTAVLSVAFCGFLYADFAVEAAADVEERYENRYYISFRDELQYKPDHPKWSALDVRINGTSTTDGVPDMYFDYDVMQPYNHPYPVATELYDTLGALPYCTGYELAYADTAYGFAENLPDWMQETLDTFYGKHGTGAPPEKVLTEYIVVGGSLDAFTGVSHENARYLYDYLLTEGREPGPGECVITDFCADLYGKSVGDTLTLYDIYGSPLRELTISGIYEVYMVEYYERYDPAVPRSGRKLTGASITEDYGGRPDMGTPFDRLCEDTDAAAYSQEHYVGEYFRITEAMICLVHTDLETAYYLYGTPETDLQFTERHHINHFFAYYDLTDGAYAAEWESEMTGLLPEAFADEFTVKPFLHSLTVYRGRPEGLGRDASLLLRLSVPLSLALFLLVSVVLVRESGRETGICLGLGISEKDIILRCAAENTIVLGLALLLAGFCGRFVHILLSQEYPYLEMEKLTYAVPATGWLFMLVMLAAGFAMTAAFVSLYIRFRTPIRLIRQE